jgi:hypothetical protein
MAKTATQGGVTNYLGNQKTVSAIPIKWKSAPNHPETELAYITKAEKNLLLKKDLHNSLNGKPNRGPGGIMSLNGWGDSDGQGGTDTSGGNAGAEGGQGDGSGGYNSNDNNANPGDQDTFNTETGTVTNSNNQNTGNDNTDMQNYMEDQTTYTANNTTKNPTISDKDRDEFFKTPVGKTYKEAAEKAAKIKAKQKADAKKEKDRIDAIVAKYKNTEPVAYSYGPPIKNYKKDYFIGPNKYSTATKMRQLALKNLIDKKLGIKSTMPSVFELNNLLNPSMVDQDYTYNSGITTDMLGVDLQDYSDMDKYGMTGKNLTDIDRMNRALDEGRKTGKITQQQFEDAFNNQNINTSGGSGGDDPIIYTNTGTGTGTTTDDEVTYDYRFGDPNANTALDVLIKVVEYQETWAAS